MFTSSAHLYDLIYASKDYDAEARRVQWFIEKYKQSKGKELLDVACGTGAHLAILNEMFEVEGLDLNENLLSLAREKLPGVRFHQANMIDFEIGRQFDVITCLFSAIGYVGSLDNLQATCLNMTRHLKPGGVLLIEPWLEPENFEEGRLHAVFVDEPDLKISRMSVSRKLGNLSKLRFHYLVGTADGIEHFSEDHELTLFRQAEYTEALEQAGLCVIYDQSGPPERGLYVGVKPAGQAGADREVANCQHMANQLTGDRSNV